MLTELLTEHSPVDRFLLSIADDDFAAGQRLSSWLAKSPTLEEDNVLTSIAQDELGHARLFYDIVAEKHDTTVDKLTLSRPAGERHNSVLTEQVHQDFADVIARNYVYDVAEKLLLESIADAAAEPLSGPANVALDEEGYHLEHAERWLEILVSTEEARDRLETGFRRNLSVSRDYFAFDGELQASLLDDDVIETPFAELQKTWRETVSQRIGDLSVDLSEGDVIELVDGPPQRNGRVGEHTDDLSDLLENIQPKPIDRI